MRYKILKSVKCSSRGRVVEVQMGCEMGKLWTSEEDGGLWGVYYRPAGKTEDEHDGECIGFLHDDGWSYSDRSTAFPGFIAVDEWVDHVAPGRVIGSWGTMQYAVRRLFEWHLAGRDLGKTTPSPSGVETTLKPNRDEVLPLEVKLARCLAFIRDGIGHNENDFSLVQRAKAMNFLGEIGL